MGLHSTVYLQVDGNIVGFGPGDDLPDEVARQIGAHAFEDGVHPLGDKPAASDGPPPKAGAGSSADAWAAYADGKVDVPDDAKRDEIIAALDAAGIATE